MLLYAILVPFNVTLCDIILIIVVLDIIWNLEFLSKNKFLTKAKTCYYDHLAKYYQKLKFIGKYYLEFLSKIKFLTKAKNYYFDQLAKYLPKIEIYW
jgi:hypothetical protein